jgi:hypothetical protein
MPPTRLQRERALAKASSTTSAVTSGSPHTHMTEPRSCGWVRSYQSAKGSGPARSSSTDALSHGQPSNADKHRRFPNLWGTLARRHIKTMWVLHLRCRGTSLGNRSMSHVGRPPLHRGPGTPSLRAGGRHRAGVKLSTVRGPYAYAVRTHSSARLGRTTMRLTERAPWTARAVKRPQKHCVGSGGGTSPLPVSACSPATRAPWSAHSSPDASDSTKHALTIT